MYRPEDIEATINLILRGRYTPVEVESWWNRQRYALDWQSPREVFPTDPQRVLDLAEWLL